MDGASTAGEVGGLIYSRATKEDLSGPLTTGQPTPDASRGEEGSGGRPAGGVTKAEEDSTAAGRGRRCRIANTVYAVMLRQAGRGGAAQVPVSHRSAAARARVFKARNGAVSKEATYLLPP